MSTTFDGDGSTRYIAIMTNLLLDVGNEDGLSFYAGPGVGFAWGKFNIDDDGEISLQGRRRRLAGDRRRSATRSTRMSTWASSIATSTRAGSRKTLTTMSDVDVEGRMHSHSLLATLTYNFYTPEPPPPPPRRRRLRRRRRRRRRPARTAR